jgi:hypothetical protein
LKRHARSQKRHPRCKKDCPGFPAINNEDDYEFGRVPTEDEERLHSVFGTQDDAKHGRMDIEENLDDVDNPHLDVDEAQLSSSRITLSDQGSTRDSSLQPNTPRIIDLNESIHFDFSQPIPPQDPSPIFKLVYIPDPTRRANSSQADGDLAFLKTVITLEEYEAMKHLTGSIHWIRDRKRGKGECSVYMQEWVSNLLLDTFFAFTNGTLY